MLHIVEGSILDFEGDAIVNAANSFLNHGGGLAKVIANAATGYAEPGGLPTTEEGVARVVRWFADHDAAPLIATGNVHVTSAGLLPYHGVIHAVGPIWNGGGYCERALLRSAYAEAAAEAIKRHWRRVAFPVLSVGIFGYPIPQAAEVAVRELSWWAGSSAFEPSIYVYDPNPQRHAAILGALKEATR